MKIASYAAWLFDVDGVITNPEQKIITQPKILTEIVKRLQSQQPVALVTGRSLDFMKKNVVAPLKEKLGENKDLLQNFLAVGEKGGVWITFDKSGKGKEEQDKTITVPKNLQKEAKKVVEEEFSNLMFFDETKRTMISTEMKDGVSLGEYHKEQEGLNKRLQELIKNHDLQTQLEIDPTTIATDIQNRHVGKDFAAQKVVKWLKEKGLEPQEFITIGDSISDIPMAEEVYKLGKPVTFAFVGKPEDQEYVKALSLPFPVIFTEDKYERGAVEFLTSAPAN